MGERVLSWIDDDYPAELRDVHDFPPIIFVRGTLQPDDFGICVVGSRNVSAKALAAARDVTKLLTQQHLTVVSGLARGIDTAVHNTALKHGGRTVAVIGTGIDRYYPPENQELQRTIAATGLVLSQFWPGMSGSRRTFPMRNAVMSAYAQATIIITATETSGTRHHARQAVAHGRPLVLARGIVENTAWGAELAGDPTLFVDIANSPEHAVDCAITMASHIIGKVV